MRLRELLPLPGGPYALAATADGTVWTTPTAAGATAP